MLLSLLGLAVIIVVMVFGKSGNWVNLTRSERVSVDEVLETRNLEVRKLVVRGTVDGNSLYHDSKDGTLHFRVKSESGKELKVIYTGIAPKGLTGGVKVNIEGKFTVEQVFLAEHIWTASSKQDHYER
ncbi:MAG: cytochrome c maturation protein CcmE [Clostridia bacterium]|nr:cytochrome c maturation protein CcmE [Clostridia bacterium]